MFLFFCLIFLPFVSCFCCLYRCCRLNVSHGEATVQSTVSRVETPQDLIKVFLRERNIVILLAPYSSSVRVNMDSSLLVLKQDLQYKSIVHLPLNVLNKEPDLTRTELGDLGARQGAVKEL